MEYLHHASFGIGVLGVLVIVFGVGGGLMKPGVQDLAGLGAMVLIRTVTSFSLNTELRSERQTVPATP
jgi:uncharacterized membrane protein